MVNLSGRRPKLGAAEIAAIRARYRRGGHADRVTLRELGEEFGVSLQTIRRMVVMSPSDVARREQRFKRLRERALAKEQAQWP